MASFSARETLALFASDLRAGFADLREELFQDGTDVRQMFLKYYRENKWLQGFTFGTLLLFCLILADSVLHYPVALKLAYIFPVMIATRKGGLFSGSLLLFASLCAEAHSHLADSLPDDRLVLEMGLTFVILLVSLAITNRSEAKYQRVFHSAQHDGLTTALNRVGFTLAAEAAIDACDQAGETVSLVLIDCNKFKQLNDTFGHSAGDAVLQSLVRALRASLPNECLIGRLGGDEFIVLSPGRRAVALTRWLEVAQDRLARSTAQMGFPATFTYGIADSAGAGIDLKSLTEQADAQMYQNKVPSTAVVDLHIQEGSTNQAKNA